MSLLRSHRRRRRLLWLASTASLVGGLVVVGLHYSNTGVSQETPLRNEPPTILTRPKTVPLKGADLVAARSVAAEFVAEAVLRDHTERSWRLASPRLRQGMTRAQWATGSIPVVPFPKEELALVKYNVEYSYGSRAALGVLLLAKPTSKVGSATFMLDLVAAGKGRGRHWLVESWTPLGGARVLSPGPGAPATVGGSGTLGAVWLLVPVALLIGAIVFLPVGLGVRDWRRRVRAERAYGLRPSGLPPLGRRES